jgi:hypothetical protein
MLRRIVNLVVTSVLKTVQDRAVGHTTVVESELNHCNKSKILVLHLVGHFVCIYIENDARNHEPKILMFKLL